MLPTYPFFHSEAQAFGRVYRLPQKRETHFARIVVENSIDSRIVKREF